MNNPPQTVNILDKEGMRRALTRIAHEILERNGGTEGLVLLGVRTRGVPLAQRIAALIEQFEGSPVPVHELDVTQYRDDRSRASEISTPESRIPVPTNVEGQRIVLVDDVFHTGRT